jgi:WD40 repeat protein
LAVGSADGILHLWNIPKHELLLTINVESSIVSLAWSPEKDLIASGSWSISDQSTITLWDVNTGKNIQTIAVPTPKLKTLSWSPNGATISAGIQENTILLWDIDSGLVRTLESLSGEVFSLSWSPDGQLLAAGTQCL